QQSKYATFQLTRLSISNFKSISFLDIEQAPDLLVFVGKNNAGKSNIFDALNFIVHATKNLDDALRHRGGSFLELIRNKDAANQRRLRYSAYRGLQRRGRVVGMP